MMIIKQMQMNWIQTENFCCPRCKDPNYSELCSFSKSLAFHDKRQAGKGSDFCILRIPAYNILFVHLIEKTLNVIIDKVQL